MSKIWKLKEKVPDEIAGKIISTLSNGSNHPAALRAAPLLEKEGNGERLLAQLLYNRGLTDKGRIEDFLEPKYESLHSPFLFKEMEKAVERIWEAIEKHQKICIYGDYDADAVTANAVLGQTFKYLGAEVSSYIPDRFTEGYGVNIEALSKIKDEESKIIITVDCGTNSVDAADFCKENNIDLIITDHHELIGETPKAYALINPKNPNDTYPYREITGVGVAFKLASALLKDPRSKNQEPNFKDGWEKWLLDLVAIGTVADCHSLLGENRILVKYGLKVLAKTKWIGLKALMQSAGLMEGAATKQLDTYTLGFIIAPRLNAAGRLEHADIALGLLLETDENKAKEKAQNLESINVRRQGLTASVLSEAREKVLMLKERKVLVLMGEGWPKGIMGLVAGKLAEEFYKPAIVLERTENLCTGSARTAGEFDILEALKFSSAHLSKFGGHKQAAGLSLEAENFAVFYEKILEYANINTAEESPQKVLELEAELQPSQLLIVNCKLLQMLQPFGVDNHTPKFLIPGLEVLSVRMVGKQSQHAQIKFKADGKEIAGILFNAPDFVKILKMGDTVEVAAELIEDNWNGREEVKLRIVDIRNSGKL